MLILAHLVKKQAIFFLNKIRLFIIVFVGRDSSVGITTRYGLEGPGMESRWRRDFSHSSRPPWGPPSLQNRYRVSFPEVKQQGPGVDHPLPSSVEVKERVELYLYASSGPSWPAIG
jgi:hypothetical protein